MDEKEKKFMADLEKLKIYGDLVNNAIWERYKILPLISSLTATLLVVATFNEKLLPVTILTKILLAILLFLIPISLISFLYVLHKGEDHGIKKLIEISGHDIKKNMKKEIMNYLPWIISGTFSIIVLVIIFMVFSHQIK